jgi:hypothetical protein
VYKKKKAQDMNPNDEKITSHRKLQTPSVFVCCQTNRSAVFGTTGHACVLKVKPGWEVQERQTRFIFIKNEEYTMNRMKILRRRCASSRENN